MLVLNGAYRGSEAVLLGLDEDTFSCSVRINSVSVLFLSRTRFQVSTQNIIIYQTQIKK